ncbi:vacuolar fusion protein CCZ1 homolog [Eurosta solidaginis]|uniref:vacuolar fusion protein CCZ1 homolog n=1 Tax=Eurosta solidaginis TaxID=178769 RepID=UPI0035305669
MSKVLQRVETTLRCFYIFNSKFGQKEGEEFKKILYYSPGDIELNTKIKDVGLSEAIIQFIGTFVCENDCKALHTQKTTQLFYQPERGYWMVMVLNVPKEVKSKDGIEVPEYRGTEVQDRIYRTLLHQCYNMYRLSWGTFQSCMPLTDMEDVIGLKKLKEKLSKFFNEYLKLLRIPVCDVLSFLHSIQYLPLEQNLFLRTHNFINMIRETFPIINEAMLLYDDRIICSGRIEPNELCSLNQYLVNLFAPKCDSGTRSGQPETPGADKYQSGAFVTGPESEENTILPKIYLYLNDTLCGYYLIIYRIFNASLCLLINDADDPPKDIFYTELQSCLMPQLLYITKDVEDYISKQQKLRKANTSTSLSVMASSNTIDDASSPKYIFINEQSLRHLTNIPIAKSVQNIPANVLSLIGDLIPNDEISSIEEAYSTLKEVQIKTTNDYWIVQRLWNWRQCYVIIHNSKATLLDITQEAKRVFDKEFTDDVFFDK